MYVTYIIVVAVETRGHIAAIVVYTRLEPLKLRVVRYYK